MNVARVINAPALPETGFLRIRQVLALIPVSRSSWWEGVRTGRYPKSVKIGPRTTCWKVETIRELIAKLGQQTPERKAA